MRDADVTTRVRARLLELFNAGQFKQARVADRLGINSSAITRYVNGPTALTLEFLDAVAVEANLPLGELVSPAGSGHHLDTHEAALIRALRQWPKSVTQAILNFVAFFADETPVERQGKNLHEMYRRMPDADREWLYSVALLVSERTLPPDLRGGVVDLLKGEATRGQKRYGRARATTSTP
jgi:transcriptional regulator with XRE-family HTH domain